MNPESADVRLENMQQLCRVCAGSEGPLVSVFGEEGNRQFLADKIHTVLPIMVTPGDWLPQRVCIVCVTALDACHSLLNTCLEADMKLRAILETCRAESGKVGSCLDEVTHWTDLRTDSLSHSSLLTEVISDVENIIMEKPHQPVNRDDNHLLTNADLTVDLMTGNSITAIDTDNHQILRLDDDIIDEVVINTYVDLTKSSDQMLLEKEVPLEVVPSQEVITPTLKTKITGTKKADNKKQKFDCPSCDFSIENEKDLKKHCEVQHNTKNRHSCPECFRVFSSATRLKEHRRRHTGELPFICEFCGKRFRLLQMLKEHLFQHGAGPHTYSCTECGKEFASRRCFKEHQETHSSRRLQCSICGKCLKGRSSYAKHQKTHVPFEAPSELKCNFCGKEHRSKQLLAEHLRTHTGERPYSCPSCKKRFAIRKTLMNHMLTHSDERKHACEVCDFRSNRRSNLLIHIKTQGHWRNQPAGVGGTVKWVTYVQPQS